VRGMGSLRGVVERERLRNWVRRAGDIRGGGILMIRSAQLVS
jgi:hypothetical protein